METGQGPFRLPFFLFDFPGAAIRFLEGVNTSTNHKTMPEGVLAEGPLLDPGKFRETDVTAKGERRAVVVLTQLRTLWFNTGSLCNLTCVNCYMESSPKNDRLAYISLADVRSYLDEAGREGFPVEEIGFTGGEPFMNRELPAILEEVLGRGLRALVLTNATKPLHNRRNDLLALRHRHGDALALRVSIDHHTRELHEALRGEGTWERTLEGLTWLAANGFRLTVAGRTRWNETEAEARRGYSALFAANHVPVDTMDPASLILFAEMDETLDVPEITVSCWDILGVAPETMMCATSRMVIKRRDADGPVVVPCTLLPYEARFEMGVDLAGSAKTVSLNHPHCARFCVLGGSSCGG